MSDTKKEDLARSTGGRYPFATTEALVHNALEPYRDGRMGTPQEPRRKLECCYVQVVCEKLFGHRRVWVARCAGKCGRRSAWFETPMAAIDHWLEGRTKASEFWGGEFVRVGERLAVVRGHYVLITWVWFVEGVELRSGELSDDVRVEWVRPPSLA